VAVAASFSRGPAGEVCGGRARLPNFTMATHCASHTLSMYATTPMGSSVRPSIAERITYGVTPGRDRDHERLFLGRTAPAP
jgi:hypothetical protein